MSMASSLRPPQAGKSFSGLVNSRPNDQMSDVSSSFSESARHRQSKKDEVRFFCSFFLKLQLKLVFLSFFHPRINFFFLTPPYFGE